MTTARRDWSDAQFYLTSHDYLKNQYPKVTVSLKETRPLVAAAFTENAGQDAAQAILSGLAHGNTTSRLKWRTYYDYNHSRWAIQKNTGTDTAQVWVDTVYVDDSTSDVTMAGNLSVAETLTVHGIVCLGNLNAGGFYFNNVGGINGHSPLAIEQIAEYPSGDVFNFPTKLKVSTAAGFALTDDGSGNPVLGLDSATGFGIAKSQDFSLSKEWQYTHGLGVTPSSILVLDPSKKVIVPSAIDVSNPNVAYFYFATNQAGQVRISTGGTGASAATINFTDGANSFSDSVFRVNNTQFYLTKDHGDPQINLGPNQIFETEQVNQYVQFPDAATPASPAVTNIRMFGSNVTSSNHSTIRAVDADGTVIDMLRDNLIVARNSTGSDMTLGQLVYFNGSNGTVPTIALAKADAKATSPAKGILMENIANGSVGRVMTLGNLTGLDLSAFSTGDVLYLSPTTAGGVVNTEPTHPNVSQQIGVVVRANASGILTFVPNHADGDDFGTNQSTYTIGPTAAGSVVLTPSSTSQRTATFPDKSGTVVYTSDLPNGFYGIYFNDGVHKLRDDTLNFNAGEFYLSETTGAKPILNLRYSKDYFRQFVETAAVQNIAIDPFAQYPYTIENVQIDCKTGSCTGAFYIMSAATRNKNGISITGLDPIAVSTTVQTLPATGANTVNQGDAVYFSIPTNAGSAKHVRFIVTAKK